MRTTSGRRARWAGRVGLAAVAIASSAISSWTTPAMAGPSGAVARINIHDLPMGARDVPFDTRVTNTARHRKINSVYVSVSTPGWTFTACRRGPDGWVKVRRQHACIYRNVSGAPVRPGEAHSFGLAATAPQGRNDFSSFFTVRT